jgi:hypothetical protein
LLRYVHILGLPRREEEKRERSKEEEVEASTYLTRHQSKPTKKLQKNKF